MTESLIIRLHECTLGLRPDPKDPVARTKFLCAMKYFIDHLTDLGRLSEDVSHKSVQRAIGKIEETLWWVFGVDVSLVWHRVIRAGTVSFRLDFYFYVAQRTPSTVPDFIDEMTQAVLQEELQK